MKVKFLIVVDMQNDFITGSLGTKEAQGIVSNVVKRIELAKSRNENILFTQDTHRANYLDSHEGKQLPVVHCVEGTAGWQIDSDVWFALDGYEADGFKKNAFGSLDLLEYLSDFIADWGIYDSDLEIELLGLCTDICVISNALMLRSTFPEADIAVNASCCAGVTPDKHKAALEVMKSCHIKVIEGEE